MKLEEKQKNRKKINENKNWFFDYNDEIVKPLAKLTKEIKRKHNLLLPGMKEGNIDSIDIKRIREALAGVAQWIECQPSNQVIGSVPGLGTCLGFRPGPQWGVGEVTIQ